MAEPSQNIFDPFLMPLVRMLVAQAELCRPVFRIGWMQLGLADFAAPAEGHSDAESLYCECGPVDPHAHVAACEPKITHGLDV